MFFIKKGALFVCLCLCIYFSYIPHIRAEMDWSIGSLHEQILLPPDQIDEVFFGSSVAFSNQYAIIGSKKDINGGSAYIFEKIDGKWVFVKKFEATQTNASLGVSVALTGNFAFAGAMLYDRDENYIETGIVYVYQRQDSGNWTQTQTLMPDPIESVHYLGCSMAAENNQLIIGAYGNTKESGKAFIFELENNQWIQRHTLEPIEPDIGGRFGIAVDINMDYAIVGAYLGYDYQGTAYIFQKQEGAWKQIELLISPSQDSFTHFGYAVSINEQFAVVGSKSEKQNNIRNTGAVYVYRHNENLWEQMPKLVEPDLQKDDKFGVSIDLEGSILAVGSTKMDANLVDCGAASIYRIEENQFVLLRKISAKEPNIDSRFSNALAFCENNILIASEAYKQNSGAVYYYSLEFLLPFDGVTGLDEVIHLMKVLSDK